MKKDRHTPRSAAAILAEITAIENPIAGVLSEQSRKLKSGGTSTYYILLPFRSALLSERYDQLWNFISSERTQMLNS